MATRILSKVPASDAYQQGVRDRTRSSTYCNPHPRGSADARNYYEGWCEKNFVEFQKLWR